MNKQTTATLRLRIDGTSFTMLEDVPVIKAAEAIDIHKLHHRSNPEHHEYVSTFNVSHDTLFTFRARAVLVTKRAAGAVMFSGSWKAGVFTPLVAYCNIQGVQKDFFLKEDKHLTGVERDHRASVVGGRLHCMTLPLVFKALSSYMSGGHPLTSGEAMSITSQPSTMSYKSEASVPSAGNPLRLNQLRQYYGLWAAPRHYCAPLETVLENIPRDVLKGMVGSRARQTKAAKQSKFLNELQNGITSNKPNNTIRSWNDEGVVLFSSGVSQTINKDKARDYLNGKSTSISTQYGPVKTEGSLLVCGCHRLSVAEVRKELGLPSLETPSEDVLPPALAKVKEAYEATLTLQQGKIDAADAVWQEAIRTRDEFADGIAGVGYCDTLEELQQKCRVAQNDLYTAQRDVNSARVAARYTLRDKLTAALRKTETRVTKLIEASDEFKEAIEANRVTHTAKHARDAEAAAVVARSHAAQQGHCAWLDFVALDANRCVLQTK